MLRGLNGRNLTLITQTPVVDASWTILPIGWDKWDNIGLKFYTWVPMEVLHFHVAVIIDSSVCGMVHKRAPTAFHAVGWAGGGAHA